MENVQVTDLYQASYLLLNGCSLVSVECIPTGGVITCQINFTGDSLDELSEQWYQKEAVVNLWSFRTAYHQVNSFVQQAKRNYEYSQRKLAGGKA